MTSFTKQPSSRYFRSHKDLPAPTSIFSPLLSTIIFLTPLHSVCSSLFPFLTPTTNTGQILPCPNPTYACHLANPPSFTFTIALLFPHQAITSSYQLPGHKRFRHRDDSAPPRPACTSSLFNLLGHAIAVGFPSSSVSLFSLTQVNLSNLSQLSTTTESYG
ncbi:LAFA_0G05028g1_1 [Lachancea sp. 'fantastica']|nr:LAFA_0G05028g1_1 [Lachancea sp. 'fantastica']